MIEDNTLTRRRFIKSTGIGTAGVFMLTAKNYARSPGVNDRLTLAIIGCGHIASDAHLKALLPMRERGEVDILAVCDVYGRRAREFGERIKAAGGDAKLCGDYGEVLAMKDVDYVLIATPEHWHARQTLEALDAGRHGQPCLF
ncbi:MAG: Gfo/Idh/MocA family protein [Planctomycetota bacterium]